MAHKIILGTFAVLLGTGTLGSLAVSLVAALIGHDVVALTLLAAAILSAFQFADVLRAIDRASAGL